MKRKTFSILYYIRKFGLRKNDEATIPLRITVDGLRADMSINRSVPPGNWNNVKGRVKPGAVNYKELNHYLEHLRQKVYQAQQDLEDEHRPVTASNLKNKIIGAEQDNARMLLQLYDEHNWKNRSY